MRLHKKHRCTLYKQTNKTIIYLEKYSIQYSVALDR